MPMLHLSGGRPMGGRVGLHPMELWKLRGSNSNLQVFAPCALVSLGYSPGVRAGLLSQEYSCCSKHYARQPGISVTDAQTGEDRALRLAQ